MMIDLPCSFWMHQITQQLPSILRRLMIEESTYGSLSHENTSVWSVSVMYTINNSLQLYKHQLNVDTLSIECSIRLRYIQISRTSFTSQSMLRLI